MFSGDESPEIAKDSPEFDIGATTIVMLSGGRRMTSLAGQMRPMPRNIIWLNDLMTHQMAEQGNSCCLFGSHQHS
jgi:hypothetical protein